MPIPRIILVFALALAVSASVAAQTPEPYIVGEAGGSFGDGGTVPAIALGFGYLTPRKIGFEIEVSYLPDLDFGDPGIPRIAIFPPLEVQAGGRIVGLQTNVIGVLPGGGTKLRAFVLAGGGVADLEQRIRVRGPVFLPLLSELPGIPSTPGFPEFPELSAIFDSERRRSETSLVLGAGTGFEYRLTDHLGVGLSVRYQRLFSDPRRLDMARAGARVTWRF